jgi:putative DNA primase/helicase
MLGAITPGRLKNYLADTLSDGPTNDGLLQRFQLLVYPDMPEYRYVDMKPDLDAVIETQNVCAILTALSAADPLHFVFANNAQQVYSDWSIKLERKLRSRETHPAMVSHLAKYRSLLPSLALLFELADRASKTKVLPQFKASYASNPTVSLEHVQHAIAWCEHLESHARRVYNMIITPERAAAAELQRHLVGSWKRVEGIFTVRDVHRNQWTGLTSPDKARSAIEILVDAGWLRRIDTSKGTGRPSEVYAINPRVQGKSE